MNLFEKLPDNFFSILSSRNKAIYGVALVVLYEALTMYRSRIKKSDYLELLKGHSEDIVKLSFENEEEAQYEPTLANKASLILKRLIDTQWVYIDYDPKSGAEYLLLPSYSINMLKLIYQFADESSTHYVSYVHTTYSDLKMEDDLQDDSMYRALENAYSNTLNLEIEVTKLDHSIKVFNRQLADIFEPNEVLKQHFDICREDVVDPIYHPLKTHDSITLYAGPISAILKRWLEVDEVREKVVDQCFNENKSFKNRLDAETHVVKMITKIQDIYFRLSSEITKIDKTQSEYIKASTDKVIFLNNSDKSIKGKIEKIIQILARNINGGEKHNIGIPDIRRSCINSIKLYEQGYLDTDSFTKPYKRSQRIYSEPLEIDYTESSFAESDINVTINRSNKYSDDTIMEFISKKFDDKNQFEIKDVNINDFDEFIYLILASIKATSRGSFYDIQRDEEKIDINVDVDEYNLPNLLYVKKGE